MKRDDVAKTQNKYPDLAIEDIKSCDLFQHFTDEQAQQVIDTIRTYTEIIYSCYQEGRLTKKSDNPAKLISIPQQETNKAA
jgi:hypothetical protein